MNAIEKKYVEFWNQGTAEDRQEMIASSKMWDMEIPAYLEALFDWKRVKDTFKDKTFLDIGCGRGRIMKPLAAVSKKVVGVDISAAMLVDAKTYLEGIKNVETVCIGTDGKLPFPANSFDFVYSTMVFQHIPFMDTVKNYVAEIKRVLKPNGQFVIQTHKGNPVPEGVFANYHGVFFKDLDRFKNLFIEAGLDVTEAQEKLLHPDWLWVRGRQK